MKKVAFKTKLALAVVAAIGITACNDSGDSGSQLTENTPTAISKTTSGVITGFGSVFINGVEYETDGTTFVVDGVEGDESLLKLGMVVTLSGTDNTDGMGDAVKIEFEDEVEGLVMANNILTDGTLNVMGLTIHTNEDTIFDSNDPAIIDLAGIVEGNIVEVSGFSAGDGSVWATRIDVKKMAHDSEEEIQVKGLITSLTDTSFVIGTLEFDYTSAVLDDDLSAGLQDGMLVKVESQSGIDENGVVIASEIELKSISGKKSHKYDDDDQAVEVEGLITAVLSDTEIEVNGAPVLFDDNTFFIHGDLNTLMVGLKVKAKGVINSEGKLLAEKFVYKPTGDLKLTGQITSLDIDSNTFSLFGKAVTIDNYTMVKDDKDDDNHEPVKYNFGVDDLAVGDWVKVKAYMNADGGLTALKMKRQNFKEDHESKLVGTIESIDPVLFELVVAGITVDYSAKANFVGSVGDKVELKGSFVEGVYKLSQLEIDEDDVEHYIGGADGHEDDEREENTESESDEDEIEEDDNDEDEDENEDDNESESTESDDDLAI